MAQQSKLDFKEPRKPLLYELGPLQKQILLQIAESKSPMYVTGLAKILDNKSHVTIFKSVKPLLENGIITSEQKARGEPKVLFLTEKGLAYLYAYCDINIEKFLSDHKKEDPYFVRMLKAVIPKSPKDRQLFYQVIYEQIIVTYTFDKHGATKGHSLRREYPELLLDLILTITEMGKRGELTVNKKALRDFISDIRIRFDHYFTWLERQV